MSDCRLIQPFDVLEFPYAFEGDPDVVRKLWIVARNIADAEVVICFKPTSNASRYRDPVLLPGVVVIEPGEFDFFPKRTFISPDSYAIPYQHLRSCDRSNTLSVAGRLSAQFRQRFSFAARNKVEWRKQQRDYFFKWFVE